MESGIGIRTPTQAIRILALLIESGVIYILIGVSSALVYKLVFSHFFFRSRALSLLLFSFTSDSEGLPTYSCLWAYNS